eukprot:scaffold75818_cov39-Tisochrysis_lutea.AAC.1
MAASAHRSTDRFERALSSVDISSSPRVQLVYPARAADMSIGGTITASILEGTSVAVLDSSFNPPTCAHMHMLRTVAERFGASHRLLLLATQNADKPVVGASLVQRLQMMELLARAEVGESTLCGITAHPLFVDKAMALRRLYGDGATIYLLVGFDTWERIVNPKYYPAGGRDAAMMRLFKQVEIVVTSRDPRSVSTMRELSLAAQEEMVLSSVPQDVSLGRLHFVVNDATMATLSSSKARGALAANDLSTAREVLPECLHEFIVANRLYHEACT